MVEGLIAGCWEHCKTYYVKDGEPTHIQLNIKQSLLRQHAAAATTTSG
jgi:hypothetical protein